MPCTTVTLYPTPGSYQDRPLIAYIGASRSDLARWSEVKAWACWQFDATDDEIGTHEVYFGGEYGDDDSREVLTVKGEIVGVFDEALTPSEWRDMLAADAAERAVKASPAIDGAAALRAINEADAAAFVAELDRSLSAEVREAARARASFTAQ